MGSLPKYHTNPPFLLSLSFSISTVFIYLTNSKFFFLDSLLRNKRSTKLCAVRSLGSRFKESKLKTKTKLALSIQGGQFKELIKLWSFKCPQLNRDTCPIKLENRNVGFS